MPTGIGRTSGSLALTLDRPLGSPVQRGDAQWGANALGRTGHVATGGGRLMKAILKRLTYANVMSTVAVFTVLGGGAYAAATVGTGQIKNNSVRTQDVRNRSLRGRDLRRNTLGRREVRNANRLDGKNSTDFLSSNASGIGVVRGPVEEIPPGGINGSVAFCAPGQRVISGGGSVDTAAGGIFVS